MSKPKVLAISGSQRKPSFTAKMLDLVLEGMGDVEVTTFYPHKMDIKPCSSCWHCWRPKTAGQCVHDDDFQQILSAYLEADYLLWAMPLYVFGIPSTVKVVVDRLFITVKPDQVVGPDGRSAHPKRFDRHPKAVLISSCGFPEVENFEALRLHFGAIVEGMDWRWAGEVLIPASGAAGVPKLFNGKYELIRQAGAELAGGQIRPETTEAIAEPVIDAEDYRQMATANFAGGIRGRLKTMSLGMKALRAAKQAGKGESDQPSSSGR